ncbi:amino acid permease [Thermostilla marina]
MDSDPARKIGLVGATSIGVGAIVGGGILALAGTCFAATGPSAALVFLANGLIAYLTAMSFAELATGFPRSGGTYVFAKTVLSVEAAFLVGWVVWFASITAAALYAIGFAQFFFDLLRHLGWFGAAGPLGRYWTFKLFALAAVLVYTLRLSRQSGAGGAVIENILKVLFFGAIIIAGLWAVLTGTPRPVDEAFTPFFAEGAEGFFAAMGYTFIAMQGFDLISAASGEIRRPRRNIPLAMFLSLAIALAIYVPLMLLVPLVGVPPGETLIDLCRADPEGIIPTAVEQFTGRAGFWLVMIAGILAMLSALGANLFAASRIAVAMATDRTMPRFLSRHHPESKTPYVAVAATSLLAVIVVLVLPDVATAGAAAGLIFLLCFTLVHGIAILARRRALRTDTFRTPLFPLVPVLGIAACFPLAMFQGVVVPRAGVLTALWMMAGGFVFMALFARPARVVDARAAAVDPELTRLRGRSPLVLVPVANPQRAPALVRVADALSPPEIGRVLLLTVALARKREITPEECRSALERSQSVLSEALAAAVRFGRFPEALTTLGESPWREIGRVARAHRCEAVLLGFSELGDEDLTPPVDQFIRTAACDVVVLRAPGDWDPRTVRRVVVPVAGARLHDRLRARLLGSLLRTGLQQVTYLRVVPPQMPPAARNRARRVLTEIVEDEAGEIGTGRIVVAEDVADALVDAIAEHDLVIIGTQRVSRREKAVGRLTLALARRTTTPMLLISQRE